MRPEQRAIATFESVRSNADDSAEMRAVFSIGLALAAVGYVAARVIRKTGATRPAEVAKSCASALIKLVAGVAFFYIAIGAVERGGGWMIALAVWSVFLGAWMIVLAGLMLYYRVFRLRPEPGTTRPS